MRLDHEVGAPDPHAPPGGTAVADPSYPPQGYDAWGRAPGDPSYGMTPQQPPVSQQPTTYYQPPAPSAGPSQPYNAANDNLTVTSSSDDDYAAGTAFTASSAGSPAMPPVDTTLVAPQMQVDPAAAPLPVAQSNAGKFLIGAGVAAAAAWYAFKK